MKCLKDLSVSRKELQDWQRNLVWGRDGTLYITSYPDMCIGQPIYEKEVDGNSKHLFHVKDCALEYENKFEYESASTNSLLNSQPISYGRLIRPSPVNNLLAVLTSNLNVIIFRGQEMVVNLDEEARNVSERSYHSLAWAPDGSYIAVGNETAEIIVFAIKSDDDGNMTCTVKANICLKESKEGWVTDIHWKKSVIAACLDDNSIFVSNIGQNFFVQQIETSSRFKITDLCLFGDYVLVTNSCQFKKIDLRLGGISSISLGIGDEFYIIPLSEDTDTVILISNKTSCKIDFKEKLSLTSDDTISPILERKFKKWSALSNEFNKYETTMLLYGLSLSPDGYSVALMYSMERVSLKYRIASEYQFFVTFVPLSDSWEISQNASGLAWYQTYQIYGCTLPSMKRENNGEINYNVGMPLRKYVASFMNDGKMNSLRFFNFIEDVASIQLFRRAIFDYAVENSTKITNLLDKAFVHSLAVLLELESPVDAEVVEMKSEFISETFAFEKKNGHPNSIVSEQGHHWRRCAVTLLPILTTKVKICSISNQRIIDIKRDNLNDYGWLTRTLLEMLNEESIYSGTIMTTV